MRAMLDTPTITTINTEVPISTPAPELTSTATKMMATPNTTSTSNAVLVSPPLPGTGFEDLQTAVSNPYHPPETGSDDPHQGIDLVEQNAGLAFAGGLIQSVSAGVVAAIWQDRFPYGNAVLIEASPVDLPSGWLDQNMPDEPGSQPIARSSLTCPVLDDMPYPLSAERSLYLLYAHLEEIRSPLVGELIQSGEIIGTIGQSGNALNPHLHLETRIGPAGAHLTSLAHYTTDATAEEMRNYCLWRISGVFRLINPFRLLENLQ